MSGPAGGGTVRIDAWLWAVRLYKTRSAATAAVRAGHVRVDGEPVDPEAYLAERGVELGGSYPERRRGLSR